MARRQKSSFAEDLAKLIALLPWWLGVALAAALYYVLSRYAQTPIPTGARNVAELGDVAGAQVLRAVAQFGQYVLPAICLIGAAISAWRRAKRRGLHAKVYRSDSASALEDMTWQEFEMLVGEGFRRQGYKVRETGGGGADGGVDLVLVRDREKTLVQCKQWKAMKVGVPVVRELFGAMAAEQASAGIIVTSGDFTKEARAFASGRNLRLLNGRALVELIRQGRLAPMAEPTAAPAPAGKSVAGSTADNDKGNAANAQHKMQDLPMLVDVDRQTTPLPSDVPQLLEFAPRAASTNYPAVQDMYAPRCPVCDREMRMRSARKGGSAGSMFWGCSNFPTCRGTRQLTG